MLATGLGAVAFVLLYQAATVDSRPEANPGQPARPVVPGAHVPFIATAYCRGETTASGVNVRSGIVAADPQYLPEGSIVSVDGVPEHYRGVYTVLDTGPMVLGNHLDLYIWNCDEAVEFGRRDVTLTILRLGWNPRNTAPAIR